MRKSMKSLVLACCGASMVLTVSVLAQRAATPAVPAASGAAATDARRAATAQIVSAAEALKATLNDSQRGQVQFAFDGPQKTRWSNFPTGIFARQGLRLGDLTPAQRTAVMRLLTVALSADGYKKVTEIMQGDEVLKNTEGANAPPGSGRAGRGPGGPPPNGGARARGGQAPPGAGAPGGPGGVAAPGGGPGSGGPGPGGTQPLQFGDAEYYLAFVGTPSTTAPWMLQFGGHHLAINLTLGGDQASMTPSLPAVQPATFTIEGRTVRPLGEEQDKAFALINALDATQRRQAVLSYTVADLVLGPGRDGRTIQPEGIRASALSAAQQTMLVGLIQEWAGIMNDAYGTSRMADIRANLNQTYFAWSGPTTAGSAAYFRIQGPTVLIEYAPQQGSTDHIHTIYRDPTNDYGAKFVRQ